MGGIRGFVGVCFIVQGIFVVAKSLRGGSAGFSIEGPVGFPWDHGSSRISVRNSGRVVTDMIGRRCV